MKEPVELCRPGGSPVVRLPGARRRAGPDVEFVSSGATLPKPMKNPTRRSKEEDLQTLAEAQERHSEMSASQQIDEKLEQLQAFVQQMSQTVQGKADLQRRTQTFGPCRVREGESSREFYGRLRRWLDADV